MITRREFVAAASSGLLLPDVCAAKPPNHEHVLPRGTAEHVILLWMGGGQSQVDTWDQKRVTKDGLKDPGSAYPGIETAIQDVQICEHLAQVAPRMDKCVPVRSVWHDVIDEHGAAGVAH